jgi:hypothetical protein
MSIKVKVFIIVLILIIIGVFLFLQFGSRSINIGGGAKSANKKGLNPITGLECDNYNRRPIAVMLAMDPVTRPLSGISDADLIIEMPVVTNSITRLMAVYVCESPEEIGSVRSARHDFIPLALGLDAIFAHWGGSHFALDKLDAGIIDNIDAMINPYNAYWQDWSKPMPHNGFTSMERLLDTAEKLGYRLENKFEGYLHEDSESKILSDGRLTIGYPTHYKAFYEYSSKTNTYKRWREEKPEIDKNNNKQVEISVVIVMRAESRMIEMPDYNDVDVEGEGEAIIYQNGEEIKGFWKKQGSYSKSKLQFLDSNGKEIKFTSGKIWIEIMEPYQEVKWEIEE